MKLFGFLETHSFELALFLVSVVVSLYPTEIRKLFARGITNWGESRKSVLEDNLHRAEKLHDDLLNMVASIAFHFSMLSFCFLVLAAGFAIPNKLLLVVGLGMAGGYSGRSIVEYGRIYFYETYEKKTRKKIERLQANIDAKKGMERMSSHPS